MLLHSYAWGTTGCAGAQVAASPRLEPAVEVLEGCEESDEEVEKAGPATEAAPRGARRFSEKYSSDGQAQASACSLLQAQTRNNRAAQPVVQQW